MGLDVGGTLLSQKPRDNLPTWWKYVEMKVLGVLGGSTEARDFKLDLYGSVICESHRDDFATAAFSNDL